MEILNGKVCLVTGASRGIGAATVKRFVEEGAIVYANARTSHSLDDFCYKLGNKYQRSIKALYFDIRDEATAKKAILQIKKEQGKLDVLVNNAGMMKDALIGMISKELMQEIYETNVFGTVNMLQLAAKLMMYQKSGNIINLSSIVGIEGYPGHLAYSASKGAVAAITKTAAKELAKYSIRVNAIAPGMIDTDMLKSIGEEKRQERIRNIRLGRLGTAEEVANVIVFLASDMSRYITGEIIGVNGGATM